MTNKKSKEYVNDIKQSNLKKEKERISQIHRKVFCFFNT